jgi:hypothetical protein
MACSNRMPVYTMIYHRLYNVVILPAPAQRNVEPCDS